MGIKLYNIECPKYKKCGTNKIKKILQLYKYDKLSLYFSDNKT